MSGKKDDLGSATWAFTYRRTFESDGMTIRSAQIVIENENLYEALKRAIYLVYGPSYFSSWPAKTYTMASPFQALVHCYDVLDESTMTFADDNDEMHITKKDVRLLLEAVKTSP